MVTRRPWLAAVTLLLCCCTTAAAATPGEIGPGLALTGNGRQLRPAGRMTAVGDFPTGGALTPDGRFFWAVDAGHGHDDVQIVDVGSGHVVQVLPLPGAYVGIGFAPDGRSAYVSGEPIGTSHPAGSTQANGGDAIHVFAVDSSTGHASERAPIALPATSGGTAQGHVSAPVPGFAVPPDALAATAPGWPEGLAVSPDGEHLVVALNQADRAAVVDLTTRAVRLVDVGSYPYGVAIARDDRTAYVGSEGSGTVTAIDLRSATASGSIRVSDANSHVEGLVADPGRDRIYAAVTGRDQIAAIDTARRAVAFRVSVADPQGTGAAPVAVGIDPLGQTLYAADSGDDSVAAISLARRPRHKPKPHPVVQVRSVGALTVYLHRSRHAGPAARAALRRRFLLGPERSACFGPSRADERAWDRAVIAAVGSHERALARAHGNARRRRAANLRLRSALAVALGQLPRIGQCPRGFIAGLHAARLIGRIPTAAYPTAVAVTPDGRRLVWLAGKGLGAGPNPDYGTPFAASSKAPYGQYVPDMLLGRVGVLRLPTDRSARVLRKTAAAVLRPSDFSGPPPGTPVAPNGPIKHVFYIVRENRTYDQIFGSDPRGDGDPQLEVFDDNGAAGPAAGVTPNAHALARAFPLLDHFYADSEVSVDGHLITSGGYAIDYVQKALHAVYSSRGRVNEFGRYPITLPPNDFLFDQAVRQGVSFRNYGEQAAGVASTSSDGRPTFGGVRAGTDFGYPGHFGCSGAQPNPAQSGDTSGCDTDSGTPGPAGDAGVDHSRFDWLQRDFESDVTLGQVPSLTYITLPNDHTNGVKRNFPTPRAMAADNDLALGQVVDMISHSPIWPQSAIFVVEDDSQDGADHVDAHRMPAFVISPWARRGAVVGTRYDQESVLRTIELILGLRPLSLFDAAAEPMYDAFLSGGQGPDPTPYDAIQPDQSLTETTSPAQARAAGPLAAALPFDDLDLVPQALFDQVLWRSVYGPDSHPPAPGPDASVDEQARANGALRTLRLGRSVTRYLEATTPVADG